MTSSSKKPITGRGNIILKQNNLIECSYSELQEWKEIHHDILNEIIGIYQHNFKESTLFTDIENCLYIKRSTLETNAKIKRRKDEDIFKILKKIRDTSFILSNFTEEDGRKAKFKTISFFNQITLFEDSGKPSYFRIEYSREFAMLCNKGYSLKFGNYARIDLTVVTNLKSKYSKALLELLESYKFKKNFTVTESELRSYLKYKATGEQFSYLIRQLSRIEKEVKKHISFRYLTNKKDKTITFFIDDRDKSSF